MTNGDFMRMLPDEGIAEILAGIYEDHEDLILKDMLKQGVITSSAVMRTPQGRNELYIAHLKWLQSPMRDEYDED